MPTPVPDMSGVRETTLWVSDAEDSRVFITATGAVGVEYMGRIVVKTAEKWVGMAWGDLDSRVHVDGYR